MNNVRNSVEEIVVYEVSKVQERRKGYASAALTEMERDARRNDCAESIIYVRKHNLPGINLYAKCGYVAFRELDDGMYMKKRIGEIGI